ncbi:MAG: DUF4364 family protein [Clostridia bacterium]|nr:DUF4364 family protein [Clostridia bacterium]
MTDSLAENKLLIMYILQKINHPVSYKELLELVISISDMNYFDFQQFLQDLLDDGFILKYLQNDEELIELTEEGKKSLSLTIDMLPGIIKLKVDSSFKEQYNKIKDEFSVYARYTPITETNFTITCKIIENSQTIFNLETFADSREQAKQIVNNWNNNAEKIYPEILRLLTEEQ